MRIMILGAAGFIGTNLTEKISSANGDVITLVDKDWSALKRLSTLQRDLVNRKQIKLVMETGFDELLEGQDIIYHLISTTVPTTSNYHIPQEISDNVELMSRFLESCVKCGVKRVIFLSSGGTVYGIDHRCPLKEGMETNPINSYGVQKVMNEKLLYLYQYMHGLDYRIIRLSNPFGPYQKPNGILGAVTTFTYKALKGEEILVYGDGSVVRDYIYIDDAVKAIVAIGSSEGKERLYNVGRGIGTSINQLLEIIGETLGITLKVRYVQGRPVDVPVNYLDISKYEKYFGKLNPISLQEGIRKTAEFMKKEYL
ncbi:NAD-dependent epimerase/dehydratase family protein [bacterium 1XD42-94]|nr:NAD-dependent epimerase/dehydratase family protein [bacterium 1XD42-76]NBK04355.1 NAD-dependent epimerase/dehydratase family protein [bacterium 1XD42-94]